METTIPTQTEKVKDCAHCGTTYPFTLSTSKFCSSKCRVAYNTKNKKDNPVIDLFTDDQQQEDKILPVNVDQKPAVKPSVKKNESAPAFKQLYPSLPPAAQYIISHLESEKESWKTKHDEERRDRKELKKAYDELKEKLKDNEHKQALQGIENAAPSFFDKLLAGLPPSVTEKVADKLLGFFPSPGIGATNGQLDGESTTWANSMLEWFSTLPKESQTIAAGLVGELTKVPADQLNDVVTRMINILQNGTSIDSPKKSNFGGY